MSPGQGLFAQVCLGLRAHLLRATEKPGGAPSEKGPTTGTELGGGQPRKGGPHTGQQLSLPLARGDRVRLRLAAVQRLIYKASPLIPPNTGITRKTNSLIWAFIIAS